MNLRQAARDVLYELDKFTPMHLGALTAEKVEALRAALALDEPVTEWQPIETFPKDDWSSRVLVCGTDIGMCVASNSMTNDGKRSWDVVNGISVNPTHWMPLPLPPAESDQEPYFSGHLGELDPPTGSAA